MSGGGDTTNTTNTGLGTKQYKALSAAETAGVKAGVADNKAQTKTLMNNNDNQTATLQKNIQGQTKNLTAQNNAQTATINTGFANTNANIDAEAKGINTNVNTGFANTNANIDAEAKGINTNLTTGFAGVNSGIAGVNDTVVEGFTATNENLGAVNSNVVGGFNALGKANATSFTSLADLMGTGFGGAAAQLSEAQKQILAGQAGIATAAQNNRSALDTYYGGLAAGQAGITNQVGGLQTDFADFTGGYDEDVAIANKARADIQTGQQTGFAANGAAIAGASDAATQGEQRLLSAVGGPSVAQVSQAAQQPSTGFANTPAPTAPPNTSGQAPTQATQLLGQAYEAALNPNIDPSLRQRFGVLASSFNPQGQLIPQSTLQDGSTVIRQLDGQGNLRFKTMASNGVGISSGAINVNETFNYLKQVGASSGGSGFATPFSQTM